MLVGILRNGYLEDQKGNQYPITMEHFDYHCLTEKDLNTVITFRVDNHNIPIESTWGITGRKIDRIERLALDEPQIRRINII